MGPTLPWQRPRPQGGGVSNALWNTTHFTDLADPSALRLTLTLRHPLSRSLPLSHTLPLSFSLYLSASYTPPTPHTKLFLCVLVPWLLMCRLISRTDHTSSTGRCALILHHVMSRVNIWLRLSFQRHIGRVSCCCLHWKCVRRIKISFYRCPLHGFYFLSWLLLLLLFCSEPEGHSPL